MARLRVVSVKLPPRYLELIDGLVRMGVCRSRAEFIREAVRARLTLYYPRLGERGEEGGAGARLKVMTIPIEGDD